MSHHSTGSLSKAVAAIEAELAAIWAPVEGGLPKTRASMANLIFVAAPAHVTKVRELIDKLPTAEVARTLLVSVDPRIEPWAVTADVDARCRADHQGEVCSERIELSLGALVMGRAASVLASLCVAEVPTILVLTAPAPEALINPLLSLAERVVIDSDELGLARSIGVTNQTKVPITDLAWERLYTWRNHLARPFDDPALRPGVTAIRKLRIVTTPPDGGGVSEDARRILAWFGSLLGWRITHENRAIDRLNQPVSIELDWHRGPVAAGALLSVEVHALLGDAPVLVTVERDQKNVNDTSWMLHTTREAEGWGIEERHSRVQPMSAAMLLERSLFDVNSDRAVRLSLAAAANYPPPRAAAIEYAPDQIDQPTEEQEAKG